MPIQLLLVEDNPGDALLLQGTLNGRYLGQYVTVVAATLREARALLGRQRFDAALLDLSLPDSQGLETIHKLSAAAPHLPIVVLTGLDDEKQALEAVCCGAEDYLLKGQVDGWAIARAIRYAMDRKRTAAALQAQEKELAAIYENAPLLMLLIDKGFRIHKVNKYATRFAGGSSEADLFRRHVGQALRRLYALEDLQGCGFGAHCGRCSLRNAVLETLATGRNHDQVETNLPCIIDGQARDLTFLLSAAQLDVRGQPLAVVTIQDITARKNAEEALQDADRRKDEFLATLAHELRNPLAPISNALGLLRLAENDVATFRQVRDMVERQMKHLVRLVDDLLDVSRITRGKIELRRERLDLAAAVQSAVETSRPHFEARQHELAVLLPETPLYVDGDLTRLAQVLSNLLHNAAKYTPDSGRITLSMARESAQVVVRVSDNGLGIPPDMLPRVFEMFAQVDKHLDRAQGGLGIGLSLVRQLVQMHGGTVEVHSAGLGEGSEFAIRLPLLEEDQPVPQAGAISGGQKDQAAPVRGRRVLVVDDNRDSAESLAQLVQLLGHEVRTAFDGPSALEVAVAFVPEFVLLDIGMPGMDGYEVALHLRQIPLLRNAVLVAQTGWGQEEDRRRSQEVGFDHHLVKPVEMTALQALLEATSRP